MVNQLWKLTALELQVPFFRGFVINNRQSTKSIKSNRVIKDFLE